MPDLQTTTPNTPSTRNYVRRIETQLKKAIDGFFEVGRVLTEAKAALSKKAWLDMINNDLPFTRRTAEKFIKIAGDPRLMDPAVVAHLPPKWTSLHELTLLNDEQFEQGITSGTINPDAERKDIKALRQLGGMRGGMPPNRTQTKTTRGNSDQQRYAAQYSAETRGDITSFTARELTLAVVRQPEALNEQELLDFGQEFELLCRKYGLEPEFSGGFERQELLSGAQKRLKQKHAEMAREAVDNPIGLLEDAFFQLETGNSFPLASNGTHAENDILNPTNQFHDMDLEELYGYCLGLQLLTKYTPIEYLDVQSFCDVQAVQALTGSPREREIAIANLEMQASQFSPAKAMLEILNG